MFEVGTKSRNSITRIIVLHHPIYMLSDEALTSMHIKETLQLIKAPLAIQTHPN